MLMHVCSSVLSFIMSVLKHAHLSCSHYMLVHQQGEQLITVYDIALYPKARHALVRAHDKHGHVLKVPLLGAEATTRTFDVYKFDNIGGVSSGPIGRQEEPEPLFRRRGSGSRAEAAAASGPKQAA
jgi:hypothetical protein